MPRKSVETKGLTWLHISKANEQDIKYLQDNFKFHHLDYEDVRLETHLAKLDTYKHYLFFIFHIPTYHDNTKNVGRETLYVFLSANQIVTLTHTPISSIDDLITRMEKNLRFSSGVFAKGGAYLMYKILMDAFSESRDIVARMTKEVENLEDAINHRHAKTITVELGHARRNVLYLRHLIDPQRNIVASIINLKRPFITESVFVYFNDLQDDLDTIWLSADNLKLLLDGLFDVNEALLSHRTNEIITLLTIISASLMIPTFIAGFYGMNVPWLPFAHSASFVSWLYIITFLLMLGLVLAIVRKRRF